MLRMIADVYGENTCAKYEGVHRCLMCLQYHLSCTSGDGHVSLCMIPMLVGYPVDVRYSI